MLAAFRQPIPTPLNSIFREDDGGFADSLDMYVWINAEGFHCLSEDQDLPACGPCFLGSCTLIRGTVFRKVLSTLFRAVPSPSEIEVKISEMRFDYTRGMAISRIILGQAPEKSALYLNKRPFAIFPLFEKIGFITIRHRLWNAGA